MVGRSGTTCRLGSPPEGTIEWTGPLYMTQYLWTWHGHCPNTTTMHEANPKHKARGQRPPQTQNREGGT
jgi:hypothetical protein